ncbi:hypothetical protein GCM10009789_43830 [Kribbella sancticallisti]|uniref:AB hydrolase-1 domain-containing protein n=1 Tax=Kribbella sancticallisti TaxID=460087 RepID=A0ABP4PPP3_9ACTN
MANFVLVAGARLGAWAWDEVVPYLRAAGQDAHPLTLSGLADKRGVPAGQQSHVQDIVDGVEGQDLRDVVLVGHSYSGIPSVRLRSGSVTGWATWSSSIPVFRPMARRSSPPGRTAGRW